MSTCTHEGMDQYTNKGINEQVNECTNKGTSGGK